MGLDQLIKFDATPDKTGKLLHDLGYLEMGKDKFTKKSDDSNIEIFIEPYGIHIHRSGNYFEEFGMLIENLGTITEKITIEDE